MKIFALIPVLLGLFLESNRSQGAENAPVPEKQVIPGDSLKPEIEKKLSGVRFAVFNTDEKGAPVRDRAWMMVSNGRAEPVIVNGSVSHTIQVRLDGAPSSDSATMTVSEKFAHVVGGGKREIVWMRDRANIVGTPITLEDGRILRVVEVLSIHVSKVVNLEVK